MNVFQAVERVDVVVVRGYRDVVVKCITELILESRKKHELSFAVPYILLCSPYGIEQTIIFSSCRLFFFLSFLA